jgi:hypothetical protein
MVAAGFATSGEGLGSWVFSQTHDDLLLRLDAVDDSLSVTAQGAFVEAPGAVALDGGIWFASNETTLRRLQPNGTLFGGSFGPVNDLVAGGDRVFIAYGGSGDVGFFAADAVVGAFDDIVFFGVSDSARSVAVEGDNLAWADDGGVHLADLSVDPLVVRDVLADEDGCVSDVDIADDVLFVIDRCSGVLSRITIR